MELPDFEEWSAELEGWIEDFGALAPVAYVAAFAVAKLVLLPAWILTLAGGAAFGFWGGLALAMAGATAGATAAFLLSRYVFRDSAERFLKRSRRLKEVDRAVGKEGWKVVMLMRLSPVAPRSLQHYFFGVTDVPLGQFVIGNAIGSLPGTIVGVLLGSSGRALASQGGAAKLAMLLGGLAAAIVAAWLIARRVRTRR